MTSTRNARMVDKVYRSTGSIGRPWSCDWCDESLDTCTDPRLVVVGRGEFVVGSDQCERKTVDFYS